MADDFEGEGGEEGGGGLSIVKILLIALPALLLGAGAGFFLGGSMTEQSIAEAEIVDPEGAKEDPSEMVGEIYKLDPFVVNLNEPRGNRYLKTTIQLELDTPELRPELERRQPQIQDMILALLASKTTKDLQALEGKFRLREELLSRINTALVHGNVKRVYFTEFVIQ
ncbi:MAG: flagellar basal body-associated FliL family protein [Magnetococcales bacterium]|nr:flagellar basal body-associated FliL family protein [Magnetococcales bacterium]